VHQGKSTIPSATENKPLAGDSERGKAGRSGNEAIQPHLTLTEGWELAKQRGYSSAIGSFKDWSSRRPVECQSQFGLKRFPAQKGRRDQLLFADIWAAGIKV
jgi:hypothetical protein